MNSEEIIKEKSIKSLGSAKAVIDEEQFPGGSDGTQSACSAADPGSAPAWGRSPEKGMDTHSSTVAWRIPRHPGGKKHTRAQIAAQKSRRLGAPGAGGAG